MGEKKTLVLKNVSHKFGDFSLKNISFSVKRGEYFVILGPTGAGKTLLLEVIAGLHFPYAGHVILDGHDITREPPEERQVGFVYQDYSLFPHMTVEENIAFGLRAHKVPKKEVAIKVKEIMELMGISQLSGRSVTTLSGGEQQRVSLARALVINPKGLLLDEPLSALDPRTQESLRKELKRTHKIMDATTIHVTHDQTEALILADRIGVIMDGKVVQIGSPQEVFNRPLNDKIAYFIGVENILEGKIASYKNRVALIKAGGQTIYAVTNCKEGEVYVFIRPENIVLSKTFFISSARNNIKGKVIGLTSLGPLLQVRLDNGLKALITKHSVEKLKLRVGDVVFASFKATVPYVIRK